MAFHGRILQVEEYMNRHKIRENSMICVYQNLLTGKDINKCIEETFATNEIDDFAKILVFGSLENKERYIGYINQVMEDYTFNRLGYIEQAILLMGCSEFDNQTAYASVIIDEAIILAKRYCDKDAYKLINSVLDKL
jgi:N utilization substance protein B